MKQRALEWEERWATPAGVAAFAAAAFYIASTVAAQSGVVAAGSNSEFLREYADADGTMLLASVLNALAMIAFAGVLYYLFKAAVARSQGVRSGLVGVVVAGPLFLGLSNILQFVALSSAASDFATPGGGTGIPIGEYAADLIREQTTYGFAQGFYLAGLLGMVFGVIYTALWAMRVGLVTRFFGTFGMALGASLILLAQVFSLLALMLWGLWLGLIYIGRVPRGRPPAWEAGEARPWAKPGEAPADEPADEDAVEAEARELFAEAEAEENPNLARRERAKRRKRKRRR